MATDKNRATAAAILPLVGGAQNVTSIAHCMTRLRLGLEGRLHGYRPVGLGPVPPPGRQQGPGPDDRDLRRRPPGGLRGGLLRDVLLRLQQADADRTERRHDRPRAGRRGFPRHDRGPGRPGQVTRGGLTPYA
ncbi:hypothetical protein E5671_22535 [Streptomyces sp. BA2]|nr:hypothetical protein [Streptomyces sp. BA2]